MPARELKSSADGGRFNLALQLSLRGAAMKNEIVRWRRALSVYRDMRMLKILLLGFISGFPWLLIGSMLSLWLKEEGLSRSSIGLFGLAFSVYAVNALWAPAVDGVRLPFFSALGRRRSWIVLMQIFIAAAAFGLFLLPSAAGALHLAAILIFMIAAASATQDVAIDALRIELIGKDEPEKSAPARQWRHPAGGSALAAARRSRCLWFLFCRRRKSPPHGSGAIWRCSPLLSCQAFY